MKNNKSLWGLSLLAFSFSLFSQTYHDDTVAVRQILDAGGMSATSTVNVTQQLNGRVSKLTVTGLDTLIGAVSELDSLKELSLTSYGANRLPEEIGDLSVLAILKVKSSNTFQYLPMTSVNLKSLQTLEISNCDNFTTAPSYINSMTALKELNLTYTGIDNLNVVFGNLTNLEILRVNNTKLTQLPANISTCTALREIYLGNAYVNYLPPEIGDLSNLEKIDYWVGKLKAIPDEIGRLKKLRVLNLEHNEIAAIPDSMGGCSSLEIFRCSGNMVADIGNGFCDLGSLTDLYLSSNQITALPDSIGKLKNVDFMMISENPLKTIPESIGGMDSLQGLIMQNCSLSTLPEGIGDLKLLKNLNLNGNQLTVLPNSFGSLGTLENLYLKDNQLVELPGSFSGLSSLKNLYLSGNLLTDGVSELSDLSSLLVLDIKNNKLTTLGYGVLLQELYADSNNIDTVIFRDPNSLKKLHLSKNNLSSLNWTVFSSHDDLEILDLSHNNLTEVFSVNLYSSFLQKLKTVNLSFNNIKKLPDGIHVLNELDDLDLSYNSLDSLPGSISRMNRLRVLNLRGNEGFKITDSLTLLSTLYSIDLSECDLKLLPSNLINLSVRLCYMEDNNLDSINDSVFMMPDLAYLDISNNNFSEIPAGISKTGALFEALIINNNEIREFPEWFCSLSKLVKVDISHNYISTLPDSIKKLTPTSGFLFEGNRVCDTPSDSVTEWLNRYDYMGHRLFQNCDIPDNPIILSGSLIAYDKIELLWDTASVNDSDLEVSRIVFRNDTFSVDADDQSAVIAGEYGIYSQFKDTLSGIQFGKRYYFSAFAGDSVRFWSPVDTQAQLMISTHALSLYDSTGTNTGFTLAMTDSSTGAIDVHYKLFNTDSLDTVANVQLLYRNGLSGSWKLFSSVAGDAGDVSAIDASVLKSARVSFGSEFGNDFVSDSLQIMITASAQFGLTDTLMMNSADLFIDFTDLPESIQNFKAEVLSSSEISLSWTKSLSTDVDSQFICYNVGTSYPLTKGSAEHVISFGNSDRSCDLSLLDEKQWYSFIHLVKDSAGNFSVIDSNSKASVRTLDVTAPDNVKTIVVSDLSHESAKVKWQAPDSVDVEVTWAIFGTNVASSVADTFGNVWFIVEEGQDSAIFEGLNAQTGYAVSFFAQDSSGNISTVESVEFTTTELGNILPVADLNAVTGEQSGDVALTFTLADLNQDTLSVRFKYSTDGVTWNFAAVTGDTVGISYNLYNGVVLNATWKSAEDLIDFDSDSVYFAVVPYDPANGTEDTIIIDLDNYHKQNAFLTTPAGLVTGDVKMLLSVVDTTIDSNTVSYYYSQNSGSSWQNAVNVTVNGDTVTWHSDSIFKNINVNGIIFKAVPNDGWADGIAGLTDTFSIHNLTTHISGDYNTDGYVDFLDFSYVSTYWGLSANGVTDPISLGELAPYTGTAPYLVVTPDSVYDYQDLGAFIKMYYWSRENRDSSMAYAGNFRGSFNIKPQITLSTQDSVVTLKVNVEDVEELVACHFKLGFGENNLIIEDVRIGELLAEGGADLLSVQTSSASSVESGVARISSEKLSVSGNGNLAEYSFKVEGKISSNIKLDYTLINSDHEVVTSGIENINLKTISENEKLLNAVPVISKIASKYEFTIVDKNAIEFVENEGFIFKVSLPEAADIGNASGEIIIIDMVGDVVNRIVIDEFCEAGTFIKWSGHRTDGMPLGSESYVAVFRAHDGERTVFAKLFIGIKE